MAQKFIDAVLLTEQPRRLHNSYGQNALAVAYNEQQVWSQKAFLSSLLRCLQKPGTFSDPREQQNEGDEADEIAEFALQKRADVQIEGEYLQRFGRTSACWHLTAMHQNSISQKRYPSLVLPLQMQSAG